MKYEAMGGIYILKPLIGFNVTNEIILWFVHGDTQSQIAVFLFEISIIQLYKSSLDSRKFSIFRYYKVNIRPEPAKTKKSSKKAVTKTAGKEGKKRKRSRKESCAIYVYKVLKQVHPDSEN